KTEAVAFSELDALVGELGNADLRALQVAKQGDEATMARGDIPHQLRTGAVLIRGTMGKIQACDIQSGQDHLFQHFRRAAGRAQRSDDFCTARSHAMLLFQIAREATTPLGCSHRCRLTTLSPWDDG